MREATRRRQSKRNRRTIEQLERARATIAKHEATIAGLSVDKTNNIREIAALTTAVDNLRLTTKERNDYISSVEAELKKRDTEIGLLELEVETLTLFRDRTNNQLRVEADIAAAKSGMLQGRINPKVVDRLFDESNKTSGGG